MDGCYSVYTQDTYDVLYFGTYARTMLIIKQRELRDYEVSSSRSKKRRPVVQTTRRGEREKGRIPLTTTVPRHNECHTCFPTLTWSFIWTLSYLYNTPTILCPLVSSSAPLTPPPPPLHHTVHMFHPSLDTLHYNTVPSSSFHSFKAGRQACRLAGRPTTAKNNTLSHSPPSFLPSP